MGTGGRAGRYPPAGTDAGAGPGHVRNTAQTQAQAGVETCPRAWKPPPATSRKSGPTRRRARNVRPAIGRGQSAGAGGAAATRAAPRPRLHTLDQSHADLQAALAAGRRRTPVRLDCQAGRVGRHAGANGGRHHRATQAHASETIAEIGRLVQAASEAPKAAADVIMNCARRSDSMVRDNDIAARAQPLAGDAGHLAQRRQPHRRRTTLGGGRAAGLVGRIAGAWARCSPSVEAETGRLTDEAAH